jgi:predicted NUDIX family NTP pyrophosphohydrolase
MTSLSAGLLVYRRQSSNEIEVLLVHPGGPFWKNEDEHAWSIPKGEYEEGDDPEATAVREYREEIGSSAPAGARIELGEFRQPSRKLIRAWAVEGDLEVSTIVSNTFELEWPKGSGRVDEYPEVDKAEWWNLATARGKLHKGQVPVIDALVAALRDSGMAVDEGVEDGEDGQASLF